MHREEAQAGTSSASTLLLTPPTADDFQGRLRDAELDLAADGPWNTGPEQRCPTNTGTCSCQWCYSNR